jgi:hypothetical protein
MGDNNQKKPCTICDAAEATGRQENRKQVEMKRKEADDDATHRILGE